MRVMLVFHAKTQRGEDRKKHSTFNSDLRREQASNAEHRMNGKNRVIHG
jgi:hypothetical protein